MTIDLDMLTTVMKEREYFKGKYEETKRVLENQEKLTEQRKAEYLTAEAELAKMDQKVRDVIAGKFIQTK